ncbi:alpha-L-fucosidase [Pontiellaceae bacterium B12227]|nr:alpha-L-fucosidase [Pontiellaceae bacterium B12227]
MNFEPTWESLRQYECPDWFRDAKFGIWAHWGPQAVPMAGDWYARQMYMQGHPHYEHHVKHYGHPSEFGFKDILPLWKAEDFEPVKLIDLYKKAGARYFTTCAVHHDNFDCWDSRHNKWNSVNMGPKKDIVGLWEKAARAAGLRFGITEHHERSYSWFNTNKGCDSAGPLKGVPYDGANPAYQDYYYEPHSDTSHEYPKNPPIAFIENWAERVADFIEKYQPDLIYTDGGIPFGEYGRRMLANYYNQSLKWHDGLMDVVYNYKDGGMYPEAEGADVNLYGDFVEGVGVVDLERGVVDDIQSEPWQTDTCIGGWYYDKNVIYKTAAEVIQMLADIVSKNGNLLLNVPLMPNGRLDDEEMKVVREIGDWMQVNGEAVYETRPWKRFGEGPTRAQAGHMREKQKLNYTCQDFRFTSRGNIIYAIGMQTPEGGAQVTVDSLGSGFLGDRIQSVEILGSGEPVEWTQGEHCLSLTTPQHALAGPCFAVKVSL